jgi:hypothetical protein
LPTSKGIKSNNNHHVRPIACTAPTSPAWPTLIPLLHLSILQSTTESTTSNQACSDPSSRKPLSRTQHAEPQEVHVRMVSLLWQMRPPIPAICEHMRQKDDELWAKWLLHNASTKECHLWILCQREMHKRKMHGLPQTRPLGWVLNRTSWEYACGLDSAYCHFRRQRWA